MALSRAVTLARKGCGRRATRCWADFMVGYVTSTVKFGSTASSASFSGFLIGAYGTYLNDGWVIDAAFKANLLSEKYGQNGISVLAAKPDATSVGGQLDAGKRLSVGDDMFIEPLASFSYLETSIGDATVAGNSIHYGQNQSARGGAGLRGGLVTFASDGTKFDLSLTGRVWDEFDGNNGVTINSGGSSLVLNDRFSGVFGEIAASINIFGAENGLSGFANSGVKFRDGFTSETLTVGARYHW